MIKHSTSILCFLLLTCVTNAQVVIQVNAGSRASWGKNQELFIDLKGNCRYYLHEVSGKRLDSSSFMLSTVQVDSLLSRADRLGFFGLSERYDGGLADGAGIFISMNRNGKKHSVDLLNKDLPPVHDWVEMLNAYLAPRRIRINYGQ